MTTNLHRIFLSTDAADRFPLGDDVTHSCVFDLSEPIVCENYQTMYFSLEAFSCPVVQYNVRSTINTLTFDVVGTGLINVSIPEGHYTNPEQLRSVIQSGLITAGVSITLSYNSLLNKFSMQNTGAAQITLKKTTTIRHVIGGSESDLIIPVGQTVVMPKMVDLAGSRAINVCIQNIDLDAKNSYIGESASSSGGILASIPISAGFGSIQGYLNGKNNLIKSNQRHINSIHVSLRDEENNYYDIHGLAFYLELAITIL